MTTSRISWARSRLRLAALIALLLALASSSVMADQAPDLTVFFSSDTRGMLRRCGCSEGQQGGVSARASYIKANGTHGRTLVLDAGDTLFDGPEAPGDMREFYSLKARTLLKSMTQVGYDAAAVGEYDLAYGSDFLSDAARETGSTLLAANLSVRGKHPFKAALVKRFIGFNAEIIGVIDDGFPYKNFKKSFKDISVTDPKLAARAAIKKKNAADIVIVLAHLSVTDAVQFTKSVPGADVVIQGHSQEALDKPVVVGNTLLVKGFDKGKRIGRLDLWFNRDKDGKVIKAGEKKIRDYKYQVITLDESIPPDPEVENIIANYRLKLKEVAFVFNRPEPEGAGRYVSPEKCRGCHGVQYTNWSTTKHARSFEALVETGDQYDPECLTCHVTGYGFISGYKTGGALSEVTCESCHGLGSGHALSGGKMQGKVSEKTCLGCHDDYQSPNFEFEKYKALGGAHRGTGTSSPLPAPTRPDGPPSPAGGEG